MMQIKQGLPTVVPLTTSTDLVTLAVTKVMTLQLSYFIPLNDIYVIKACHRIMNKLSVLQASIQLQLTDSR